MTVQTTTNKAGPFVGNNAVTQFSTSFRVDTANDLQVMYTNGMGVETVLSPATYGVSGFGADAGITVTYPLSGGAAIGPQERLTLLRTVANTQSTSITNQGGFYPKVIENALDRVVYQCQQLAERMGRAILLPVSSGLSNLLFPSPMAGQFLRGRSDGSGWENADITGGGSIGLPVVVSQGGTGRTTLAAFVGDIVALMATALGLGSAATRNAGMGAGNVLLLANANQLPVMDGSLLTGLAPGGGAKNFLINGKMDIAQRGTSFPGVTQGTGVYSVDRWRIAGGSTSAILTISQQADVPTATPELQNSLRVTVTTADASVGAPDIFLINQVIEGYNARALVGKTFTLSFWVKSSKTGIHCVFFENGGADRTYVAEYAVNVANTWEFKAITVTGGLITAGTWNWTNGYGLGVGYTLMCGSAYQATANAWQTGNFGATSNQVNVLDTVGNLFALAGVQLELGPSATPFEHRAFALELQLCKRYYEKSFPLSTVPAQNAGNFAVQPQIVGASTTTGTAFCGAFTVEKRGSPVLLSYNPSAANVQLRNVSAGTDWSGTSLQALGTNGFLVVSTSPAGSVAGSQASLNWTADAEL
jgi:hypothetical protein